MTEDELQRPINIILDVRVSVAQSMTNYQAALHGLIDANKSELRKEWHVQVLAYYREISRHSSETNINDMWNEQDPDLVLAKGESRSLAEIRDMQFETEIYQAEVYDNRNKTTKIVEQERMSAFEPEILMQLTSKLDRCVAALGFDAAVKSEIPHFGYKGMDEDTDKDE
jgi:hypothetical protein